MSGTTIFLSVLLGVMVLLWMVIAFYVGQALAYRDARRIIRDELANAQRSARADA